jgi:hypothetical protein
VGLLLYGDWKAALFRLTRRLRKATVPVGYGRRQSLHVPSPPALSYPRTGTGRCLFFYARAEGAPLPTEPPWGAGVVRTARLQLRRTREQAPKGVCFFMPAPRAHLSRQRPTLPQLRSSVGSIKKCLRKIHFSRLSYFVLHPQKVSHPEPKSAGGETYTDRYIFSGAPGFFFGGGIFFPGGNIPIGIFPGGCPGKKYLWGTPQIFGGHPTDFWAYPTDFSAYPTDWKKSETAWRCGIFQFRGVTPQNSEVTFLILRVHVRVRVRVRVHVRVLA